MYTRAMMFEDNAKDGEAAHSRYYGEIVRQCGIRPSAEVLRYATLEKLAEDRHMNNVRNLQWWDACAAHLQARYEIKQALKDRGDFMSISAALCLLKEAVRMHYSKQL